MSVFKMFKKTSKMAGKDFPLFVVMRNVIFNCHMKCPDVDQDENNLDV